MAYGPQMGSQNRSKVGFFSKTAFGICCFISFISIIMIFAFKSKAKRAMSGQLVSLDGSSPVSIADEHQVMNKFLDYFGNSTILVPLVCVYICYKIFISKSIFKKFDGFVIGTSIIGFNFLLIGFSSMLSAMSPSSGGLLGDFFYLYLFNKFPFPIGGILIMLVTFGALFLFTLKGPVWYIDHIGNLLVSLFNKLTGKKVEQSTDEQNNTVRDNAFNTSSDLASDNPFLKDPQSQIEGVRVVPNENQNQEQNINSIRQKYIERAENKKESMFSSFTNIFSSKDDTASKKIEDPKTESDSIEQLAAKQPHLKNVTKGRNALNQRVEPQFSSFGMPTDPSFINKDEPRINPETPSKSVFGANRVSVKADVDNRPTTSVFSNSPFANLEPTPSLQQNPQVMEPKKEGPSTVINGLAVGTSYQGTDEKKEDTTRKTIITRLSFDNKDGTSESISKVHTEVNGESKVIYKAGADNIEPRATVGSPMRNPEVSTVIIRTTTTPKINVDSNASGLSGQFTQPNDNFKADAAVSQKYETSVNHTPISDNDQNIINFEEFDKEDVLPREIKVDTLPSDFKRTDSTDDAKLNKNNESLIKESDESYGMYKNAVRGVNSNSVNTQNTDESAPKEQKITEPVSTAFANNASTSFTNNSQSFVPSSNQGVQTQNGVNSSFASVNTSLVSENAGSVSQEDNQSQSYSQVSVNPPFENMSSLSGNVPRSFNTATRAPIGKIPTVSYSQSTETIPKREYDSWRPPFSLLARSENQNYSIDDEIEAKIYKIDQFMKDFNVKAQVADYVSGPVITRYDLTLAPGVRSNSISKLNEDLQRTLMTNKINVLTSMEGKSFVGVEVPNDHRMMITLGDVVQSEEFATSKAFLPMCLGVDTTGTPIVADLASAPHLLIAGTTGSGKSAGLNSMLVSMLLSRSPAELRLIMIDPKTVEFTQYHGLPHLICPIITDPLQAVASLSWLIKEQERRYKLLSLLHVSKISQCNDLIRSENAQGRKVYDPVWTADMGGEPPELKPLPYIVLVIDEFADLVAVSGSSGKKGDQSLDLMIGRLAGKARAAGIHIILATQTPRSDIVTGAIRANLPSRIAYTVQNGIESRIILDEPGAENLLGYGDMMVKYQHLKNNQKFRGHGPFASNEDVQSVVNAWIERAGDPEYIEDVTTLEDDEDEDSDDYAKEQEDQLDIKFDSAVEHARRYCAATNRGISVTELQSELKIGFVRARNLHRQLQKHGIIDQKGFLL